MNSARLIVVPFFLPMILGVGLFVPTRRLAFAVLTSAACRRAWRRRRALVRAADRAKQHPGHRARLAPGCAPRGEVEGLRADEKSVIE